MSISFITYALCAVLGVFVVVVSQAFSPSVLGWVAFGVAAGVMAIAAFAQLDLSRVGVPRTLDGATVAVAWLLMAFAIAASGTAVTWLSFAFGLGIVGIALSGLSLHEVANWRAQRHLASLH
jgi:hypothetical protein